jgi:hypothetical protein
MPNRIEQLLEEVKGRVKAMGTNVDGYTPHVVHSAADGKAMAFVFYPPTSEKEQVLVPFTVAESGLNVGKPYATDPNQMTVVLWTMGVKPHNWNEGLKS